MPELNFNTLKESTMELTMRDPDKTVIRVTTPTEGLMERLQAAVPEMKAVSKNRDPYKIRSLYELIAEVISCNYDYITVTAEELKDKYKLSLGDLMIFMSRYLEFIYEIHKRKN